MGVLKTTFSRKAKQQADGWGQWASYPDAVEAVELGGAGPGR